MKIAYLINLYPKISHSFIRREILAIESLGDEVVRFSIRSTPKNELVDKDDLAERDKTYALLDVGLVQLFRSVLKAFVSSPRRFVKAFLWMLRLLNQNRRRFVAHFAYFVEACHLLDKLVEYEVEHLHTHFGTNSTAVAMLCRILGGPEYSFTVHGPEEYDNPEGLALKDKIHHCKFVVAISSFGRSQLMRWSGVECWPKIKVVHCAVDSNFLTETVTAVPDVPRLVSIGRLCKEKAQALIVEALHQVASKGIDFQMVFVGDGEMRAVLEKIIEQYHLQDKIFITGWLDGTQIKREIQMSRAMVFPSFAEGLPVVIMEALALGRPVLSTYLAGIPELVKPDENGWLIPAGDVEALAEAIILILQSPPEQLSRMGQAGAKEVAKHHQDIVEAKKLRVHFCA